MGGLQDVAAPGEPVSADAVRERGGEEQVKEEVRRCWLCSALLSSLCWDPPLSVRVCAGVRARSLRTR